MTKPFKSATQKKRLDGGGKRATENRCSWSVGHPAEARHREEGWVSEPSRALIAKGHSELEEGRVVFRVEIATTKRRKGRYHLNKRDAPSRNEAKGGGAPLIQTRHEKKKRENFLCRWRKSAQTDAVASLFGSSETASFPWRGGDTTISKGGYYRKGGKKKPPSPRESEVHWVLGASNRTIQAKKQSEQARRLGLTEKNKHWTTEGQEPLRRALRKETQVKKGGKNLAPARKPQHL